MLIREGEERTFDTDIRLAALLSGVAGAINAATFQATGLFSANMTGNVSALSDSISLGQVSRTALMVSLVLVFIVGAFSSGLLIEAGRQRGVRAIYAYSISFEAVMLIALGAADLTWHSVLSGGGLILGMSFVMGLQNAATTRISNARVRTTHVSGMATDIGLGLAAMVTAAHDRKSAVARLRLYLFTIIAFLAGGVAGVALYLLSGGYVFVVAGWVLLAIAVPEVRRARRS
ncbi:hypothetical protein VW35_19270 [Devosia soli]|uniref:Transmembrane protein n=1 Tax=Devosia soli TaxID=361041 RepID=A0A0F5L0E1_9HYPH|nr:YoaK family protein [Devosia soli]KKB75896.1 hypothetical protein VW35_19270 [Devosia soli]